MTKFVKFLSKDCAAGAPSIKNGEIFTEEMARAEGYLPLEQEPLDKNLIFPVVQYRLEKDKVVEYYIEGKIDDEDEDFAKKNLTFEEIEALFPEETKKPTYH